MHPMTYDKMDMIQGMKKGQWTLRKRKKLNEVKLT
jgi:hypothetical protein